MSARLGEHSGAEPERRRRGSEDCLSERSERVPQLRRRSEGSGAQAARPGVPAPLRQADDERGVLADDLGEEGEELLALVIVERLEELLA